MKKILYLILVVFSFSGCITFDRKAQVENAPYKITKHFNSFTDSKTTSLVYNPVLLENGELINFLLYQFEERDVKKTIVYQIILSYTNQVGIEIDEGESLIIIANGETIKLSGRGSWDNRKTESFGYGAYLFIEVAAYVITEKQLLKIINASNVEITVMGRKSIERGIFLPNNFYLMRQYRSEVMR